MKLRTKVKRLKEENERLKRSMVTIEAYQQIDTAIYRERYIDASKTCIKDSISRRIEPYLKWDQHRFTHNPYMITISAELTVMVPEGKR